MTEQRRPIYNYNLDVIISVGYRVMSKRGIQFRIWATGILRNENFEQSRRKQVSCWLYGYFDIGKSYWVKIKSEDSIAHVQLTNSIFHNVIPASAVSIEESFNK